MRNVGEVSSIEEHGHRDHLPVIGVDGELAVGDVGEHVRDRDAVGDEDPDAPVEGEERDRAEEQDQPETVADRFDLDVAAVYHALAYYHDHPREMSAVEAAREEAYMAFSDSVTRPEDIDPDSP